MTEQNGYSPEPTGNSPHEDGHFLSLISADRYMGMEDTGPRPVDVTVNTEAPGGVIVPHHLVLANSELPGSEIEAIYEATRDEVSLNFPPEVSDAWLRLELALSKREDDAGLEEKRRELSAAQENIRELLGTMGERDDQGDLRILFDGSDAYRYLAIANAFEPAYQAQLERRAMRPDEHQIVCANMGDLVWQSIGEIGRTGMIEYIPEPKGLIGDEGEATAAPKADRILQARNALARGAFGELVAITASAHPNGRLLYPTPQRGFRRADVQTPYRDQEGRSVERLADIKLGESSGGEPPNKIRVGSLALRAVNPNANLRGETRAARAWGSLIEVGSFAAADARGINLSQTGQAKIDRFAHGLARRIDRLNSNTGLDRYLQAV